VSKRERKWKKNERVYISKSSSIGKKDMTASPAQLFNFVGVGIDCDQPEFLYQFE